MVTIESFDRSGDAPTLLVRVFRHGELVHRELCESEEEAAIVTDFWAELDGVMCQVDDLSAEPRPDEINDGPADRQVDEYPVDFDAQRSIDS